MIYKGIDPNGLNKVDSGSVGIFVENTQSITLRNDGFVTIGNVPSPDKNKVLSPEQPVNLYGSIVLLSIILLFTFPNDPLPNIK